MGKLFEELDARLREFIAAQQMYFVATAPLSAEAHVNLSPKGLDTFRVVGPKQVAYLDLVGSGVETVAHLRENGRITIMFCAFGGGPRILRLYGKGRAVEPGDDGWTDLIGLFPYHPGVRSVVFVDLERVADSCGYGVPLFEFVGERKQLTACAEQKGEEGMAQYKKQKNRTSIDGLPGLRSAQEE
ncbi:MAG: pyridoxamine 5'-phosphate oxidase family protein [Gemmataceae bacterium]